MRCRSLTFEDLSMWGDVEYKQCLSRSLTTEIALFESRMQYSPTSSRRVCERTSAEFLAVAVRLELGLQVSLQGPWDCPLLLVSAVAGVVAGRFAYVCRQSSALLWLAVSTRHCIRRIRSSMQSMQPLEFRFER